MLFPNISSKNEFILKDLPGSGKRIDVLCRVLATVFDWASSMDGVRTLFVDAVLSDLILHFISPASCHGKGETWWASHIQSALHGTSPEFIIASHESFEDYIRKLQKTERIIVLHEEGVPFETALSEQVPQYSFMLGNHQGFEENAERFIQKLELPLVSLGTRSYLGSHCVATIISKFEAR